MAKVTPIQSQGLVNISGILAETVVTILRKQAE
jgi:hypothetical protein